MKVFQKTKSLTESQEKLDLDAHQNVVKKLRIDIVLFFPKIYVRQMLLDQKKLYVISSVEVFGYQLLPQKSATRFEIHRPKLLM